MQAQVELPAPPRRRNRRPIVVGVALLVGLVLAINVVSNALEEPLTSSEWIDENMTEEFTVEGRQRTFTGIEFYEYGMTIQEAHGLAFGSSEDLAGQWLRDEYGLSADSEPSIYEVRQELDARIDPPTPQTNRTACIEAGGQWVGGYDELVEAAGGNCLL